MPFQSEKQRRYLWANEPEIARDWTNRYGAANGGGILQLVKSGPGRPGYNGQGDTGTYGKAGQSYGDKERYSTNVTTGSPHGKGPQTVTSTKTVSPKDHFEQSWSGQPGFLGFGGGYRNLKTPGVTPERGGDYQSRFGIGNLFRGAMSMFGGIPGRVGSILSHINPNQYRENLTGYKTQQEYEDARTKRQNRGRIDRLRKTRDYGKYANDPEGWAASDLSGRLTGFEKDVFGKDYVDYSRTTPKARDLKALRDQQALTSQLSAKDFINLDQSISASGYKPQGFMENLQSKFGNEVRPAAAVKSDFLKQQSWYNSPLKLRQNTFSTALGENAQEKMQAFQELKSLVPRGTLTVEKYLDLAQQNKIPSIIAEDMNEQVLEAIKEQGGFGDTFPKNYSFGNIEPTIEDGRIDIDETKIDDDYKDRLKYLEVAEGGLASLWPR